MFDIVRIEWDTEGNPEGVDLVDVLPTEVRNIPVDNPDDVWDWLSDNYGYLVNSGYITSTNIEQDESKQCDELRNHLIADGAKELSVDQARELLTTTGYNAYGDTRLYGVISGGDYNGQIKAVKSTYHLDQYTYDFLYTLTSVGIPIRKA